jgi:O-antigen/teichoic acid export membrane protein
MSLIAKFRKSELILPVILSASVRAIGAGSAFGLSVVIGQYYGVKDAGIFFISLSLIMVLAAFSRCGLDNTVLRFIGAEKSQNESLNRSHSIMKKSLVVTVVASVISTILLIVLSESLAVKVFDKPELTKVIKNLAPSILGIAISTIIAMYYQGKGKVVKSVFLVNISSNLILILILTFIEDLQLEQAAFAFSMGSLIIATLSSLICMLSNRSESKSITWSELLSSCAPLWIVVVMGQLTLWSGQFIAGVWVSTEEIAQLAAAQRISMLTSFVLMAVNLVVAPKFSNLYHNNKNQELESLAKKSVRLMLVIAFPVLLLMILFPSNLLNIYGPGFSDGAVLLQILCLGQFINVLTGSVGFLLSMSGHEKDLRNAVLFSGPIAIIICLLLVPIYGVVGSAVATALAISCQNLVAAFWVKKRLGFNTLKCW